MEKPRPLQDLALVHGAHTLQGELPGSPDDSISGSGGRAACPSVLEHCSVFPDGKGSLT